MVVGEQDAARGEINGVESLRCFMAATVSIIIPCYRQGRFLGDAVESAAHAEL